MKQFAQQKQMMINKDANFLIIGQGAIGLPVTNKLAEFGCQVTGLARAKRENYGLHVDADFMQADALQLTAEQLAKFSHIAIIVTPDTYNLESYKQTYYGIAAHIAKLAGDDLQKTLPNLQRIVFISSTGVYGQNDAEWIDETIEPISPEGGVSASILQAESVLQQTFNDKAVMIRPSGIYGKDRLMRIRKAQETDKPALPQYAWTNRIMDTDLVNIITNVLLINRAELKPMYLATDYAPVTSYELTCWLSEKLQSPMPKLDRQAVASGKRLHSNIPSSWLRYPDWQSGYEEILKTYQP